MLREDMVKNYPYWAIRELLMNGCMHRDLQSNTPLRFYEFSDHLEITNAGGLYGNARPENFPKINDYRNPIIAGAMKSLGYVNKYNRGIGQVQKELSENGNPKAEFDVNLLTAFAVTVYKGTSQNEVGYQSGTSRNEVGYQSERCQVPVGYQSGIRASAFRSQCDDTARENHRILLRTQVPAGNSRFLRSCQQEKGED